MRDNSAKESGLEGSRLKTQQDSEAKRKAWLRGSKGETQILRPSPNAQNHRRQPGRLLSCQVIWKLSSWIPIR
ncbi:hypothetical protein TWF569_005440 [Orbilia oligospora]|nr:hypothetical protein TWF569_005440 [Orbilia oligospora]